MTHEENTLRLLKKNRSLTQMQALKAFGCMRLAEYIRRLRKKGHIIETTYPPRGKQYAIYKLIKLAKDK